MTNAPKSPFARLIILVTLALSLVIGYVMLIPISDIGVPGSDKLHHFLAFFALALPLSFARPRLAPLIILVTAAYGGTIELIQPYVGRHRDVFDLLADGAGSVLGAAVGVGLGWLRRRVG